ncbi:RNA polymerase recycling motor HelD [Paenibacillus senegalensis]|uniref:RNA polymerase recycling motor HelD n=1 Tax=Paenibacillus senegalensis TaxID=1465766 RepID=UPI00028920B7|nr:RNA polymerase recycling motor HelD [Paenibacillus senegalensis]
MSQKTPEWIEEQQRVDRVKHIIEQRIHTLEDTAGDLRQVITDYRKSFWDDVTVNLDEPDEVIETAASMKQQAEVLAERERSYRHAHKQRTLLERLKSSPYFGRIDFMEEGDSQAEQVYLGIGSLLDEREEDFLIYDWRAPISSLYYDHIPGPVEYETPAGTIRGTMELKRQFIIRWGSIESMFDTGVTIGDELLKEVLGQRADKQMKTIVATIQREQNLIIRNERSRLLVVQGAAGSGKTSAALQRVAYLLYRYRGSLSASQIVLFSPNPMFNSYVSTVLPELGEENMEQTTYQEYLEHRLGSRFVLETPFAQMEYVYSNPGGPSYEAKLEGIRFKASIDYKALLDNYMDYLRTEGLQFTSVKFRQETLIEAGQIYEWFYALDPSLSFSERLRKTAERLLKELKLRAREERKKPWVEEEIELLDKEQYQEAYHELLRKKGYSSDSFDDFEREQEFLAAKVVQLRFKKLRRQVKQYRFVDWTAVYRQLFSDVRFASKLAGDRPLPSSWSQICEETVNRLDRSELAYEDATPYLYLKESMEGFQINNTIRHVLIDEVQDYSPFQLAYLRKLFPRSKMTVLGDLNQAIYAHATGRSGLESLADSYGEGESEWIRLTKSYRSTKPIVEMTQQVIEDGEQIEPFQRDGVKPVVVRVHEDADYAETVAERIRSLRASNHRTIAIITKTAAESREAWKQLNPLVELKLVDQDTTEFEKGITIIPSYLAKGVEFDAVIVYNASEEQYGLERERKLFYTACTRAMHELVLVYRGSLTPFMNDVDKDRYVIE